MTVTLPRAILSVGILLLALPPTSSAGSASTPPWVWPIAAPHPVSAPFIAPPTPYAPGHRGIDIAARPGAPVSAPADGIVTFTGKVVDRPLVVVRHENGLVSSIEPVVGSVSVGDTVVRGGPLGTVGSGGHCGSTCAHFGVRRDGAYVNPLALLDEVPAAILLPVG